MSGRYKILKTFEQKEWLIYCPVKIEKGQLLLDTQKNKIVLQLKMFNLSSKHIRTVYLNTELLDDAFDYVCSKQDISYQGLDISPKSNFGDKTPIYFEELNISFAKITITKVIFTDDDIWRNENKDIGIILPNQKKITQEDELYSQIQREFEKISAAPIYWYESYPDYWRSLSRELSYKFLKKFILSTRFNLLHFINKFEVRN